MKQQRFALMLLTAIFSLVSAAQIPNDSIVADFRYFVKQLEATHPDPYTNYGGKAFFHRAAHEAYWALRDDSVTTTEELCCVPSCQAPNTYMEQTPFTLPRTKLKGSISNSLQLFLPVDDPCAKQLTPDLQPTYDDFKRYHFDEQAEVLYLLDKINEKIVKEQ